ncbi:MAG TPA: hypothetical protein VMT85_07860 [Thermoanaerobaculia bacterium]|nr:hypothetical protein [Thermoanaerobaculia bacterium]
MTERPASRSADTRARRSRTLRAGRTVLVVVVVLFLLLVAVDVLADGPLCRHIEQEMNARLEGYHVALSSVDFSPWNLSLELQGLAVVQEAHPEPAVAAFPRIAFSVQWLSILRGHVVGDVLLEAPALHIDLERLREERDDEIEIDERREPGTRATGRSSTT